MREARVEAWIAYSGRKFARPRYYANAHARDEVEIAPVLMPGLDGRTAGTGIDREGFELVSHRSAVGDFRDREEAARVHVREIEELVQTGAGCVHVGALGLLRSPERSGLAGRLNNAMPARYAHNDISDATARQFAAGGADGRSVARCAHYKVWHALSPAPHHVPHVALDLPGCPADSPPRVSIEMRATAWWWR